MATSIFMLTRETQERLADHVLERKPDWSRRRNRPAATVRFSVLQAVVTWRLAEPVRIDRLPKLRQVERPIEENYGDVRVTRQTPPAGQTEPVPKRSPSN